MARKKKGIPLNDATSQYKRLLDSVRPDSVEIDSRTFSELLNFAVQFGSLVEFYDLNDQPDGDWTPFFLTDPTMILASIESLNLRSLEDRFLHLLEDARQTRNEERKLELLSECFQVIYRMARKIEAWLGGAQINPHSRAARLFVGETASMIDTRLSGQLGQLKNYAEAMWSSGTMPRPADLDFRVFGSLWRSLPAPDTAALELRGGHSKSTKIDQLISLLDTIFRAFFEAFHRLQKFASKHLPETLEDRNHKPQIGLYIAFVRLFQTAQKTINTITERFTSFYYHDVLREKEAGPVPDSVYLTFTLDPASGLDAATVPKGAQFPAGKEPDGSSILYAADATTSVTAATLQVLRALRVVQGPLYAVAVTSPSSGWDELAIMSSPPAPEAARFVLGTEIDLKVMNDEAAGKLPADGLVPWPPFGATKTGATAISSTAPVTLGFAIASPYLMLTGGDRTVRLVITVAPQAARTLDARLGDLSYATGLSTAQIFQQLVDQAFDLWLSTTDGWFQVTSYFCSADFWQHRTAFTLGFTLDSSAPPVVAFNPPPNAPPPAAPPKPDNLNPAPELPTLKAYLKQDSVLLEGPNGEVTAWPLSVLEGLSTRSIEIRTSTVNLTDLQISGITGQLDTSAPWPVFGAVPVTGAYLDFSNPELFVKTPDPGSLKVSLTWFGLPADPMGFAGYYQGYLVGMDDQPSPAPLFDNQTFRGELRVVNPGTWDLQNANVPAIQSPPDEPFVYLFRTINNCSNSAPTPDGTLCPDTTFESEVVDVIPPQYYDPAASAIRLTLTEPPYAFGNTLYAPNVLNSVVSELPKPHLETGPPPGCLPLSDAAASLEACLPANGQPPPSKEQIEQVATQTQGRLIQAAQGSLSRSLAPYGEDVASWIQDTFTVYGSQAPPYRAQKIRGRLEAALASMDPSSRPVPVSPPGLPRAAAVPIRRSIDMLRAVVMIQQSLEHCSAENDASWQSCIQTQLAACRQKLLQACAECAAKSQPLPYPNPPWLPQARSISVSYEAHTRVSTFFYILPWGGYESVAWSGSALPLLPVPPGASLELGFSGLDAPQSIDMLVQMAAGSAAEPPEVSWQYLAGDDWVRFDDAQIPADTTNGLQNTGILSLNLPAADTAPSTVVSGDYRWLRAVTARPESFPDAIGIYPHPITATWVNDGTGSGEHLAQPVPPYTIKSSVQSIPGIKAIDQPIESFGGRPAENEQTFRIRLSERLRHKERAILPWDYERLVLENFPAIWKVKAIPAARTDGALKPGHVLVTVVAGSGGVQVADPTEPLASADILENIRSFLASIASPFACIQVVNPTYVRIQVTAEVIFQDSPEGGGGIDVLNSELVEYLSPWFYDAERASLQGQYASEDAITQFIQTRPWVASLVSIGFDYEPPPATLQWYFLTSAKSHSITQADAGSDSKGAVNPCSRR